MNEKKIWKINKTVLPQDSDHVGVMWHGTYFNWLEEGRINALSNVGIDYFDLSKNGYELPLIDASIKYILPLHLGDKITIESSFNIGNSPKIKINSKFINERMNIHTVAEINLDLIDKKNFSIVRKRPDFISQAFMKLNSNQNVR